MVLTVVSFFLYILLGAIERVTFARMAFSMPDGVLLMHTLLALMSLLLFLILQLARSQGTVSPNARRNHASDDEALQRLYLPDVLSIAVLDVLHSLLALAGATDVPGVVQALLIQATVPAIALFAVLLPAVNPQDEVADEVAAAAAASGMRAPPRKPRRPNLGSRIMQLLNDNTPASCASLVLRAPRTYQILSSLVIAGAVLAVALSPLTSQSGSSDGSDGLLVGKVAIGLRNDAVAAGGGGGPMWLREERARQQRNQEHAWRLRWHLDHPEEETEGITHAEGTSVSTPDSRPGSTSASTPEALVVGTVKDVRLGPATLPGPGEWRPSDGPQQQQQQQQQAADSSRGGIRVDGRWLLIGSTLLSALGSAHKRRCLSQRPVDLLVFNTSLAALQLFVGLLLGPPLLLTLSGRPIKDTLVQLARGLRCFMSGMNPNMCGDSHDAFGVRPLPTDARGDGGRHMH